jgi:8-amino-7-oxononanoate synthase
MLEQELKIELEQLRNDGALRSLRDIGERSGVWIEHDGRKMLNLSSNDYLGYGSDMALVEEFYSGRNSGNILSDYGLGSLASRLLSGNHPGYGRLETALESLYGRPALVFCSGYHANIGVPTALAGKDDLVLADKLVHASLLDGLRLSQCECRRYPHLDMDYVRHLLEKKRADYRRVFLVTESVFSMDGDCAPLGTLAALKKDYDLVLYVDEAHGVGTRGERGLGLCEEQGVVDDIDIIVGTFGKALAGHGAYVVCAQAVKDYLVNRSRPMIFTTALPPVVINWNAWILEKASADRDGRARLAELSSRFRAALAEAAVRTAGNSHIVPAICGENKLALDIAARLSGNGYMAMAVRPPTVPPGTARIRFSLSAGMQWADVAGIPPLLPGGQAE